MEEKIKRKLVRKSGQVYTETLIEKELFGNHQEFSFESFALHENSAQVGQRSNASKLTVCKSGNGLMFKSEKYSKSRVLTHFHSLGLDEIEILIQFLSTIKPTLKNYSGTVIENTTSQLDVT
jgi:hypothetical protein